MFDLMSGFGIAFAAMMTFVVLFIVGVVVLMVVMISRNARRVRAAGRDPMTLQADLAVSALDSRLLAPERPLEARLAELDDLARRGVITAAEREHARADLLAGR